jgi:hypothetical protein
MKTQSGGGDWLAASRRMPRRPEVDSSSILDLMSIQYAEATDFISSSVAAIVAEPAVAIETSRFTAYVGLT